MHLKAIEFTAPTRVITPTSPNTQVETTPIADPNNTTNLVFSYQGRIPVWTPSVSQAQQTVKLGEDITIGGTTWKAGITVTYSALGSSQYTVMIMSGEIIDNKGIYDLAGLTLGIFPITKVASGHSAAKLSADFEPANVVASTIKALSTVNTPTSPNSNVLTVPSGDTNNTTYLSFQYQGRIPVWTPSVSQAQQTVKLGSDIVIGSTMWKTGITVTYAALGSSTYVVTIIDGTIIDDRGSYNLTGVTLGIFPIK